MTFPAHRPTIMSVTSDTTSIDLRAVLDGHDVVVHLVKSLTPGFAPVLVVFIDGNPDAAAWVRVDTGATGPGFATPADLAV